MVFTYIIWKEERKRVNMMLIPRRNEFDLLEDMLRDPFFNNHENKVMKTDIKEKENQYVIDIEIPSYDKENIKLSI